MKLGSILLAAAVFAFLWPAEAHAAGPNESAAVAAFDEGEKLMASQNFAEACAKYAESYRLDPQLGALLHLADCYEKNHQLASAWARFRDAADLAERRSDERLKYAQERIAELEPRLTRLRIVVPPPAIVPGLEVRRDGVVVGQPLWGSAIPVDPGEHVILASAPGKTTWTGKVTTGSKGRTESISIVPLAAAPEPSASSKPSPAASAASSPPADERSRGAVQRVLGWSSLGVGAVGIGVGITFMLKRADQLNERAGLCPNDTCRDASEERRVGELADQARTSGTIGAIGLIAGGALAGAGVLLVITAPSGPSRVAVAPRLESGFRGVTLMTSLW